MRCAPLLALAGATLLVSCSPPDVTCNVSSDDRQEATLDQSSTGTLVLSASSSQELRFELLIEQTSELGFTRIADPSSVWFSMALSYDASQPPGAQLPQVSQATFFIRDGVRIPSDYPGSVSLPLSTCDEFTKEGCCPVGATTCRIAVGIEFAREDIIFPDVQVNWTARVQIAANHCSGDAPLSLTMTELGT